MVGKRSSACKLLCNLILRKSPLCTLSFLQKMIKFPLVFTPLLFVFSLSTLKSSVDSPQIAKAGSPYIYADLVQGDSRETVLEKLRKGGFIQIYEERDKGLVRCTVKWNRVRYQLVCKIVDDKLTLCLFEGQKGWQDFFYDDVVFPQWKFLKDSLTSVFGENDKNQKFPSLNEVPLNDMAGFITDTWDLSDRLVILTLQTFMEKDCCTEQMLQYSCCTLLIQPKASR